ncbi:MAG: DUF3604 domain-containing protein [Clostridia bacterium]|nr:DUF3604 domain-containing protein [Clostridia bacterium]
MNHPDKYKAKRFDTPGRSAAFTDIVYREEDENTSGLYREMKKAERSFDPPAPELKVFVGEMHGHSMLSDGKPTPEEYFRHIKDIAKLDFAALTDHDHGGVGKPTLWANGHKKWKEICDTVNIFNEKGKFTTLLGYERDSYPFYNNLVIYFRGADGELMRDGRDGELTEARLKELLSDENLILVPHDTYSLSAGADFIAMEKELHTPLMEIISRGDAAEYMGNPAFVNASCCEGGFWRDALKKGSKMGVIAGSDDHDCMNGTVIENEGYPRMYPGVTGIWAKENTRESIFDALKAKRTYAFMLGKSDGEMRGRIQIDFRINGHWMGETVVRENEEALRIYFNILADVPIKAVTLVKNCRDYMIFCGEQELILDYRQEADTDVYYLRVELCDGRFGWTSPVWVEKGQKWNGFER